MANKQGAKNLGDVIKRLRLSKGLNRPQFEEKFGVDDGYLNNIERGTAVPGLDTLVVIARGLEVSPGFLANVFAGVFDARDIDDPNLLRRLAVTDLDLDRDAEVIMGEIAKLEEIRMMTEELIAQKKIRKFPIKNFNG